MLKKPDGTTAERKQRLTMIANNISETMMFFFFAKLQLEREDNRHHIHGVSLSKPHTSKKKDQLYIGYNCGTKWP